MSRSRLWLFVLAPILVVSVLATQHFGFAHSVPTPELRSFNSCDDLHEHYLKLTKNAWSEEDRYYEDVEEQAMEEEAEQAAEWDESADSSEADSSTAQTEAAETVESEAAADQGEVSETGTNIQERGVDESDIIKTDGTHFYVLRPQSLLIAEISADGPLVEVGRIHFEHFSNRQELLIGSGKVVVARRLNPSEAVLKFRPEDDPMPLTPFTYFREQTELLEIDVSQPDDPTMLRELTMDGRFISARMVGHDVRVAMQHGSPVPWTPYWSGNNFYEWSDGGYRSHEAYFEEVQNAFNLSTWFPLFGLDDHDRGTFDHGYVVDCGKLFAPTDHLPIGWGTPPTTAFLLSFDLTAGIHEWGSVGLLGTSADPTVYASTDSLYLAVPTNRWWQDTAIHRFDVTDTLDPTYFGGAVIEGRTLSQWSLSEHDGYLRIATTNHERWPTVSSVTVLEAVTDDVNADAPPNAPVGSFEQVGQVTDLGRTETIFAVRFAGDVGYVVTFRQTDPLYVLDLSDPTDPREVGELKIPGFSRYLHPLSGGLLLGIGRDADPRTGWERGLQASLFDVSDPANPTQITVLPLGDDAFSPVETNHRAFRYQNGVAWVPVGPDDWSLRETHDGAFLGVRVTAEGLSHESTLRVQGAALRAMPIGERIHLLSGEEIRTYNLETYADLGTLSFAHEWDNRWMPLQPE